LVIREVGGVLRAMSRAAASALRNAIALAAQDETEIGRSGLTVRLTAADAPPLFANVLRLAGNELRPRLVPAAIAAIFIALPPDRLTGQQSRSRLVWFAAAAIGYRRRDRESREVHVSGRHEPWIFVATQTDALLPVGQGRPIERECTPAGCPQHGVTGGGVPL